MNKFMERRIEKTEKELSEYFIKLGKLAYSIGIKNLGKKASLTDRVEVAVKETGATEQEIVYGISLYLDNEMLKGI